MYRTFGHRVQTSVRSSQHPFTVQKLEEIYRWTHAHSFYLILRGSRILPALPNMSSLSPERGRTRSRQQTSAFAKSQTPSRTRSAPRRTISPRSESRSRTPSRTPSARGDRRNVVRNRGERSRSPTRISSRSRSGGRAGRRYRDRSYTRTPSRGSLLPKSTKVGDCNFGHGLTQS